MDALSQTLRVVRLVGAIFINARFTAPWCYQSPSADTAAPTGGEFADAVPDAMEDVAGGQPVTQQ
jgi:hypothetical protein